MKKSITTIAIASAIIIGTNINSAQAHIITHHNPKHTISHHHKQSNHIVYHHIKPKAKLRHKHIIVTPKRYVKTHDRSLFSFIFKI